MPLSKFDSVVFSKHLANIFSPYISAPSLEEQASILHCFLPHLSRRQIEKYLSTKFTSGQTDFIISDLIGSNLANKIYLSPLFARSDYNRLYNMRDLS
jgi:hypothetical protein